MNAFEPTSAPFTDEMYDVVRNQPLHPVALFFIAATVLAGIVFLLPFLMDAWDRLKERWYGTSDDLPAQSRLRLKRSKPSITGAAHWTGTKLHDDSKEPRRDG